MPTRGKPLQDGGWCTSCGDVRACMHHPDAEGIIAAVYWEVMKRVLRRKGRRDASITE